MKTKIMNLADMLVKMAEKSEAGTICKAEISRPVDAAISAKRIAAINSREPKEYGKGELKYTMIDSVFHVEKKDTDPYTVLHAYKLDGTQMVFTFIEGGTIDFAAMMYTDKAGRRKFWEYSIVEDEKLYELTSEGLEKKEKIYRYRVVKNGYQILFNEFLWQLDRISRGEPVVRGEYNHWLPRVSQLPEVIGIYQGDVVPKSRNMNHKSLFEKIYRDTGTWVSVPSYHDTAYTFVGRKAPVTVDELRNIPHIDQGFYLEIVPEDQYRWCVCFEPGADIMRVNPVRYGSSFDKYCEEIKEFDSLKKAKAYAYYRAYQLGLELGTFIKVKPSNAVI